jgi:hypothetical protein
MTKDQVAALAAGKDDVELLEVCRKFGVLPLACDFDGVPIAEGLKSTDFTRENPFAHLALRDGHVDAVTLDISERRKFRGAEVSPSKNQAGEDLPILHTLFKGETAE